MVEITKMDDRGKLSLAPVVEETEPADTEGSAAHSEGPEAPAEG
jgi:polyribonucleotide nucleotidyltransferase